MHAEEQLKCLISTHDVAPKQPPKFREWFVRHFRKHNACKLEDFAIYFLHTLRQCTEQHLRNAAGDGTETPKSGTPVRTLKPNNAMTPQQSNSNFTPKRLSMCSTEQETKQISSFDQNQTAAQNSVLSSSSFNESLGARSGSKSIENSLNMSNLNCTKSSTSTPVRRGTPSQQGRRSQQNLSAVTSTPQSAGRDRHNSSGLCLGDFLFNASPAHGHSHQRKKKTTPQHNASSSSSVNNVEKPKKRVVPTTISKNVSATAIFGSVNSSSFSNENNLLRLRSNSLEIVDHNQCAVLEARKSLKQHANEISKELQPQQQIPLQTFDVMQSDSLLQEPAPVTLDLTQVVESAKLELLATIYAQLIDLNLVPNVLSELAYLLQLLNVLESSVQQSLINASESTMQTTAPPNSHLSLLAEFPNCIYFALHALEQQQELLLQLDLKSLGVVLNNERISLLPKPMQTELEKAYRNKQKLLNQPDSSDVISIERNSSFKNVYYQQDTDSRAHFPSQYEFGAFKTQRDMFYKTFKQWESNHLNSNFNFTSELSVKVRSIFRQSEHAVNMAHFAKLFVAQLLISESDCTTAPHELGIDIVDLQKFSKLTKRLFAPSNFGVDYQFPRSQVFFRDFINDCESLAFLMQLKLALYAQLIQFNDSNFEQLQLQQYGDETDDVHQTRFSAFIVRPTILAPMLILAKFLGYVTSLPYNRGEEAQAPATAPEITRQQILLRTQFQPDFNACELLQKAIDAGKLLITLPWLVQYLAMLDSITLQMSSNIATLQLLFELYSRIGVVEYTRIALQPTAVFIIRCCIGWLLETKSQTVAQYYNYHALVASEKQVHDLENLISKSMSCLQLVVTSPTSKKRPAALVSTHIGNILEQLLNFACPSLPEFRVAIMPAKYASAKCASRTGRYRHITTRFAVLSTSTNSASPTVNASVNVAAASAHGTSKEQQQRVLTDAFLHSQHASMRRLIEFITERTYKSVVKDAQHQILLPSKAAADDKINKLTSCKYGAVLNAVHQIYETAHEQACQEWTLRVPVMIDERIEKALDTLLPAATNDVVKQTYAQLIKRNASAQVQQWLQANVLQSNFYCADLQDMTQKICRANQLPQQNNSGTDLCIVADAAAPSVSDLMDELKYWLHVTSMRPELMPKTAAPLEDFFKRISGAFVHTLPAVFYRLVGSSLVQICQHIISRHTLLQTSTLTSIACGIWNTPQVKKFSKCVQAELPIPGMFDALITVVFIESLGSSNAAFVALEQLLIEMINAEIITVDFLNVLFVPLFKLNWPTPVWTAMSNLLAHIAQETLDVCTTALADNEDEASDDGGGGGTKYVDPEDAAKSHLFMEVLADLSRDLDF